MVFTLSEGMKGFGVYSDTSWEGLGCVIMKHEKVEAYASRQFKVNEMKSPTHDIDLVVVVISLNIWKNYFYGVHVNLYTEHKCL